MNNDTSRHRNKTIFNITNTNARSLRPKMASFIDSFNELETNIAIVTETWFKDGEALDQESENLLLGHGIKMVTKSRVPGRNGVAHGGVAIFVKDNEMRLKVYNFPNPEGAEVLPVEAKIEGVERKCFIIGAYLPPGYSMTKGRACLQHINNLILELKTKFRDCLICLSGDFNQWEIDRAVEDFPDLAEAITPPTRNNRLIDRTFINWEVTSATCLAPLETEAVEGTQDTIHHNHTRSAAKKPMEKDNFPSVQQ